MLASSVEVEQTGSQQYQTDHMGKLFEQGFSFSGFERDKLYLNQQGRSFVDISGLSGLDSVTDGRGAAYADFDNDGDVDIFLTAIQGQVHHLFRNNVGSASGFLRIALRGTVSGLDAFGTVVRLGTSQGVQAKIKAGGSGFVSQSDPRLLFGLAQDATVPWIEVHWPSGRVQRFSEPSPGAGIARTGSSLLITEGQSDLTIVEERRFSLPEPTATGGVVIRALRPQVGDPFPAVPLIDPRTQVETDFHRWRQPGHRYLVNLWATWCVPCRQEMPELQKLYPELQAAGVEILGVSLDTEPTRATVSRFLDRAGITYPNFTTRESGLEQLFTGDQVFVPVSFVLDAQGRITDIFSGWSRESETAIRRLIQ
ncbi:MAG: redoxin family protein [bacterium]|nr:redoxin family protein [bacterium]